MKFLINKIVLKINVKKGISVFMARFGSLETQHWPVSYKSTPPTHTHTRILHAFPVITMVVVPVSCLKQPLNIPNLFPQLFAHYFQRRSALIDAVNIICFGDTRNTGHCEPELQRTVHYAPEKSADLSIRFFLSKVKCWKWSWIPFAFSLLLGRIV